MSELKVYRDPKEGSCWREFYEKSEADKVITEKDKNIDLYKRGWEESDRINAHLYAELRHNKYKRCLAMADYCFARSVAEDVLHTNRDGIEHADYWICRHKMWLKLAEHFKPEAR